MFPFPFLSAPRNAVCKNQNRNLRAGLFGKPFCDPSQPLRSNRCLGTRARKSHSHAQKKKNKPFAKRKIVNRKNRQSSAEVSGFLIMTVGVSKAASCAAGVSVNRVVHSGHHVVMFVALEACHHTYGASVWTAHLLRVSVW